MHRWIDSHRRLDGILTHELLVDLQHALELVVDLLARVRTAPACVQLGDVQIDLLLSLDALADPANAVGCEAHKIAAEKIPVNRIQLLAEVPAIRLGDFCRPAFVLRIAWCPKAPTFSSDRFRDETALVLARDCCWMDLDHLRIPVFDAVLVADGDSRA